MSVALAEAPLFRCEMLKQSACWTTKGNNWNHRMAVELEIAQKRRFGSSCCSYPASAALPGSRKPLTRRRIMMPHRTGKL